MPPKAKKPDKSAQKAKAKQAEDKTFGLKNKNKSSKVQKYVQQVQQAATQTNRKNQSADNQPTKKELELKKKEEIAEIFKPVQVAQKVPFGVDPKSVLCQFFKAGICTKGKNCKFSHDLNVDKKSAKIDLYTDIRSQGTEGQEESMENWDQAKLEDVISKKHSKQPPTDIVCKYFIQAVEDKKYGWFWQCPNGADCKYKHALPPGFVLKEQQKKKKADEPVQTLEEWIEEQRASLPKENTPVTLESFQKWKQDRMLRKQKEQDEQQRQREQAIKAGKSIGASGRELFTYNPNLLQDDDDVLDFDYNQREESDNEEEIEKANGVEVDESAFLEEDLEDLDMGDEDEEDDEDQGQSSKA
ncbi:hypothetical protein MP638_006787 [Amoeboaphelidium occidentale]|nr:hypothetical protein MP638_006787 [Amoeboaphelidium occidentale]